LTPTAFDEYRNRRAARAAEHARLARLDARVSYARLCAVAAFALIGWLVLAAASLALAVRCCRLRRSRRLPCGMTASFARWIGSGRAVTFYDHGIGASKTRGMASGQRESGSPSEDHLYSRDLDIFGHASLFQLLSRARTHLGEELLARWLSAPGRRPDSARATGSGRGASRGARFSRSTRNRRRRLARCRHRRAQRVGIGSPPRPKACGFELAAVHPGRRHHRRRCVVGYAAVPIAPLLVAIILKMILTRPSRARVARTVRGVERPLQQLDVLADTLLLIERSTFRSPYVAEIRAQMLSHGVVPSGSDPPSQAPGLTCSTGGATRCSRRLQIAVSWALHLASAIESWRREFGSHVIAWLNAVASSKALSSLGAYAYEHGDDPFPVFVEDRGPARFEGTSLGHPIVPAARMVRNDVFLTPETRLLIVSGSNMSGKSTLLRTVGVNVVLAMAGAPVRAAALTLTPLAVGATLHVHDSLQAGRSRFYAEISRIRNIADLAGRTPAPLFLLDELFQGTNSHDRKIGAEALLLKPHRWWGDWTDDDARSGVDGNRGGITRPGGERAFRR
jgi:hypothetical protein